MDTEDHVNCMGVATHLHVLKMATGDLEEDLKRDFERLQLSRVKKTSRKELGRGAYGVVFEVEIHGTQCAAKEMHPELSEAAESDKIKRDFLNECIQSSRILHPNVVQFIGVYNPSPDATELPWLVMELMDTSLNRLIAEENKAKRDIPLHFKLSILVDTCKGLQFLHSKDIIHRDLSSNNMSSLNQASCGKNC